MTGWYHRLSGVCSRPVVFDFAWLNDLINNIKMIKKSCRDDFFSGIDRLFSYYTFRLNDRVYFTVAEFFHSPHDPDRYKQPYKTCCKTSHYITWIMNA